MPFMPWFIPIYFGAIIICIPIKFHYAADGTAHIKVIPAYYHQSYTTCVYQNNIWYTYYLHTFIIRQFIKNKTFKNFSNWVCNLIFVHMPQIVK